MIVNLKDHPSIARIAKAVGSRKRKAIISTASRVDINNTNWSGGTRYTWHAVELATARVVTMPTRMEHPANNPVEGAQVEIPFGVAIVSTGTFCGKPAAPHIYVRPDNQGIIIKEALPQ